MNTKTCTCCKLEKDTTEFYVRKRNDKDYIVVQCKKCIAEKTKKYHTEHPEINRKAAIKWRQADPQRCRRRTIKWAYGITIEEYETLVAKQNGQCAICGTTNTAPWPHLCIDHDHNTGKVRGLLCGSCNQGIGRLKDSPVLCRKAAEYLEH